MRVGSALWIILALLLATTLNLQHQVSPVSAEGKIIIKPDGTIDPPTAPIERNGSDYKLTGSIYNNSIDIQKDSITLNGNSHSLQDSTGSNFYGIQLSRRQNVTLVNVAISGFINDIYLEYSHNNRIISSCLLHSPSNGIYLYHSTNNNLTDNILKNAHEKAIYLYLSDSNILSGNTVTDNERGVFFQEAKNNILRNNIMTANKPSIFVYGYLAQNFINDADTTNTVDGKPVYYWTDRHDQTVPLNAGTAIVVNSSGITVENLVFKNNSGMVEVAFSHDCLIKNVTVYRSPGIYLLYSYSNVISENNVTYTGSWPAIMLELTHYNRVANNYVSNIGVSAIWLEDTMYNTIIGNTVINSSGGSMQEFDGSAVLVDDSVGCNVIGNYLSGSVFGVTVGGDVAKNLVMDNNIVKNEAGIGLWLGQDNKIYHNNFIENKKQVRIVLTPRNSYDDGYPHGGNYWSDYTGWDANNDGIGDLPYVINQDNLDRYPLMSPYGESPLATYNLTIGSTVGGTTNPQSGVYRHFQGQKIPVTAIASVGYSFDHWQVDGANIQASNPVNITIDQNHDLHAIFTMTHYSATVRARCNAEGADVGVSITVDGLPTEHTTPCELMCTIGNHTFSAPTHDMNGHLFKQWSTGETSTALAVNSGGIYTAYYDVKYSLLLTSTFGGTTNPVPATYIDWSGTTVEVTAFPEDGYYLDYWELDGLNIGAPNPLTIAMDSNSTLNAVFTQLSAGHDIAVKYIASKAVAGQGYPLTITVKAMNVGNSTEAFNVTTYVNATPIGTQTITLESGAFAFLNFTWDTTGFARGNYVISAFAEPVEAEIDTADNLYVGGIVRLTVAGDLNGDSKVDGKDIAAVARAFNTKPGDGKWDERADINSDNTVDGKDIAIVSKNFGKFVF